MEEEQILSESEKKKEDWMNSKWRPMMGWMYMVVCTFDFIVAPVLWSLVQAFFHGGVNVQWQPLTLQGAGLFHISMGAVLGLAAYGRTQEKLAGANNGGAVGTTYTPPAPIQATVPTTGASNGGTATTTTGSPSGATAFGAPSTGGFGTTSPGFGAVPPASTGFGGGGFGSAPATATVVTGFGGKPGPAPTAFPVI